MGGGKSLSTTQETEQHFVQLDPNAGETAGRGSGKDPEVGGLSCNVGGTWHSSWRFYPRG